jgi:hypothetical protein
MRIVVNPHNVSTNVDSTNTSTNANTNASSNTSSNTIFNISSTNISPKPSLFSKFLDTVFTVNIATYSAIEVLTGQRGSIDNLVKHPFMTSWGIASLISTNTVFGNLVSFFGGTEAYIVLNVLLIYVNLYLLKSSGLLNVIKNTITA